MILGVYTTGLNARDDFDNGKDLRAYEWRDLAEDIYRNVRGKIAIYPLDWGGESQAKELMKYSTEGKFELGPSLLQGIETDETGEYRKIITPGKDARIRGIKKAILFDDWLGGKTGKSALGGLVWGIENAEELGVDVVYIAGMVDFMGMAPFAGRRKYDNDDYIGPLKALELRAPQNFERLRSEGLLDRIGERRVPLGKGDTSIGKLKRNFRNMVRNGRIISVADV